MNVLTTKLFNPGDLVQIGLPADPELDYLRGEYARVCCVNELSSEIPDDKEIYYGYGLIFENPSLRFAPDYLEHDNLWFGDEIKAVSN